MSYILELRRIEGVGHRPLQVVGCCAYLFDKEGKILLTKRKDDDTWCVPGGIVELSEAPIEAVKREVKEETGLVLGELTLVGVSGGADGHHIFPNGDEIYSVDIHYLCKDYVGVLQKQENEIAQLQFFDVNNLPNNLWESDRKIIDRIIEN